MELEKSPHHDDVWLINSGGKAVGEIRGRKYMAEMEALLISPDFHKVAIAERDQARHESAKWAWMMDYCKKHGMAPAPSRVWNDAEEAYEKR
jgi:hypothetical protein